jgi:dihydroorotate dehydrogenase (fumarate)
VYPQKQKIPQVLAYCEYFYRVVLGAPIFSLFDTFTHTHTEVTMTFIAGGVGLSSAPVMIGAGVAKQPEQAEEWLKIGPTVAGSFTGESRGGNRGTLFFPDSLEALVQSGFGLNSYGMPNIGFERNAKEMAGKNYANPLIISIAGFSTAEYIKGVQIFSQLTNVDAIELNFGCPNTEHGEILSFDGTTLATLLEQLCDVPGKKPLWLKFSPFSNPAELTRQAKLVSRFKGIIKAVVTCNTFPNGFAGEKAITTNLGNYGGVSGPALKPIAMGQVRQFRNLLSEEIDVIGVGGITTGNDIIDFLDAGATAVQLTSLPFWLGKPNKFWDYLTNGPNSDQFSQYLERSSI